MNYRFATMLGIAALLTCSLAPAQITPVMRGSIPFEFRALDVTFPAGTYEVRTGIASGVVQLACIDCPANAMLLTLPSRTLNTRQSSSLIFRRYGDRYFLAEVRRAGYENGFMLKKTKAELEIAAANSSLKPSHVEVALQR